MQMHYCLANRKIKNRKKGAKTSRWRYVYGNYNFVSNSFYKIKLPQKQEIVGKDCLYIRISVYKNTGIHKENLTWTLIWIDLLEFRVNGKMARNRKTFDAISTGERVLRFSARRGRIFLESGLKPKPTSLGRCAGLVSQPTMASGMASVFNYQTEGRCNCV